MNETIAVKFRFRGNRRYLHSTTIFDQLAGQDPLPRGIDFAFHKMTDRHCSLCPDPLEARVQELVAVYRSQGAHWHLYEEPQPITERYDCNEDAICAAVQFESHVARFEMPPCAGASFLEAIVGSYKQLLTNLYPNLPGKLVFARTTLDLLPVSGNCRVEHVRRLGNDFFQARLWRGDQQLGKLIFALQ